MLLARGSSAFGKERAVREPSASVSCQNATKPSHLAYLCRLLEYICFVHCNLKRSSSPLQLEILLEPRAQPAEAARCCSRRTQNLAFSHKLRMSTALECHHSLSSRLRHSSVFRRINGCTKLTGLPIRRAFLALWQKHSTHNGTTPGANRAYLTIAELSQVLSVCLKFEGSRLAWDLSSGNVRGVASAGVYQARC